MAFLFGDTDCESTAMAWHRRPSICSLRWHWGQCKYKQSCICPYRYTTIDWQRIDCCALIRNDFLRWAGWDVTPMELPNIPPACWISFPQECKLSLSGRDWDVAVWVAQACASKGGMYAAWRVHCVAYGSLLHQSQHTSSLSPPRKPMLHYYI